MILRVVDVQVCISSLRFGLALRRLPVRLGTLGRLLLVDEALVDPDALLVRRVDVRNVRDL